MAKVWEVMTRSVLGVRKEFCVGRQNFGPKMQIRLSAFTCQILHRLIGSPFTQLFPTLLSFSAPQSTMANIDQNLLKTSWQLFDKNGNGCITPQEVGMFLQLSQSTDITITIIPHLCATIQLTCVMPFYDSIHLLFRVTLVHCLPNKGSKKNFPLPSTQQPRPSNK